MKNRDRIATGIATRLRHGLRQSGRGMMACFGEGERLMAVAREQLKGVGDAG
jgi:hypothetical protein